MRARHRNRAARRVWLPFRRFQPSSILGSLFQLPTLMGFALQSFSLPSWSTSRFQEVLRSCAFLSTPVGLIAALQRFAPTKVAGLLFASQRVRSGRSPLLSWVFSPLGYSPGVTRRSKYLSSFGPLSFLDHKSLTELDLTNLRVFRVPSIGLLQ
jgi:hypothetical protein